MSKNPNSYTVIVPAAGVGRRMQADVPKQYLMLGGKTILEQTLERLISHPKIGQVVLALHPQDPYFESSHLATAPWLTIVEGGKERADSVLAGLNAVTDHSWVLVHDAARPCLRHKDLDNLFELSKGDIGGILATPVRDTMKRGDSNNVVNCTESREHLWHALTPQFFPRELLHQALQNALTQNVQITDEASAIEWAGGKVKLVEASASNIKITRPEDLQLAEFYIQREQD